MRNRRVRKKYRARKREKGRRQCEMKYEEEKVRIEGENGKELERKNEQTEIKQRGEK